MNPRTQAIAYRIWCHADPRGWDVSIPELAEALEVRKGVIIGVCQHKGWLDRLRVARQDRSGDGRWSEAPLHVRRDAALEDMGRL